MMGQIINLQTLCKCLLVTLQSTAIVASRNCNKIVDKFLDGFVTVHELVLSRLLPSIHMKPL
jgi:hypothetical protein